MKKLLLSILLLAASLGLYSQSKMSIRINLYVKTNASNSGPGSVENLFDGVMAEFGTGGIFNDVVDVNDAPKFGGDWNPSVAIARDTGIGWPCLLAVERRTFKTVNNISWKGKDSIYINNRNLQYPSRAFGTDSFLLKVIVDTFNSALKPVFIHLVDKYLGTDTLLSSNTLNYSFKIYAAVNSYTDRFKILLSDTDPFFVPENIDPVAKAGNDTTIYEKSLYLNGSGYDTDGSVESYSWKKLSGPTEILNNESAKPYISNLLQGTYKLELTVTDNKGAIGKDTVNITVINKSDNLSIYPNPARVGGKVKIDFNNTYLHQFILVSVDGYKWNLGSLRGSGMLNIPNVTPGIYYLLSMVNDKRTSNRILIY